MTIKQINMALVLSAEGNFSSAAEACFISQSALSKQIMALEEELGFILFERKRTGATPTPAGEDFLRYACRINRIYQDMMLALAKRREPGNRLTVGTIGLLSEFPVLQRLYGFEASHPQIGISIQEMETDRLLSRIGELAFDAVIAWREMIPPSWSIYPLAEDAMVLLVRDGHPIVERARHGEVSLADVKDEKFCLFSMEAFHSFSLAACAKAGFNPVAAHYIIHPFTMIKMVSEGMGVGLMFETLYNYCSYPGVRAIRIKEEYKSQLAVGFLNPQSRPAKILLEHLMSDCKK